MSDLYQGSKQSAGVRPINHSIIGLDNKFKLWCWILNKSTKPFLVEIGMSEAVGDLKKVIKKKKKHTFFGIDPVTLDIWKVSMSSWLVSVRISDILEAISTHSFLQT